MYILLNKLKIYIKKNVIEQFGIYACELYRAGKAHNLKKISESYPYIFYKNLKLV